MKRNPTVSTLLGLTLVMGCGGGTPAVETPTSIRFAVEPADGVEGSFYVLLNGEDDQPGWVRVFHNRERIYLKERCEIPDCGVSADVCGAAIPFVREIAAVAGGEATEFLWDGMTSVLDSAGECETRATAPPGEYVAQFCYSRTADIQGQGDVARGVMGRVVAPTCVDVPFSLQDEEVILRVPADSS